MKYKDFITQIKNEEKSAQSENESSRFSSSESLESLIEIVKKINNSLILDEVLRLVVINAIKIAKAERGFLILVNDINELQYRIGLNAKGEVVPEDSFEISWSVVKDAFDLGESICIENALQDQIFNSRQSIMNLELQTILCTPLIADNERIGVIYVDSKYLRYINKNEIIKMFEIMAGHAAVAIRNAKLYKSLNDAFTEVQQLHERLIQTERITLKKEINSQIGQEVQKLVHLSLLENDSISRKLQRLNINIPLNREQVDELIQKLSVSTESIRKIQRFSQTLIDSTQCVLNKDIHDINKVIRSVSRYLKHMNKFKDAQINLNLDKVPLAEFDAEQIEHVLVNILNNAVENKNDVTIKISTYFDIANQEIVVQISDNGKGISPNLTSEIFLTKLNNDTEARGMGLKMCKKIIENHQGKISVLSDVGNGTTFFFTIPIMCKQ